MDQKKPDKKQTEALYEALISGKLTHHIENFSKMAKKVKKEEFVAWANTGEIPAVKLTADEMSTLQAGGLIYDFFYGLGVFALEGGRSGGYK